MSNGWPGARSGRRVLTRVLLPIVGILIVLGGCAQGQKRPGFLEKNAGKPLFPNASAPRPEPGLRVKAPGVDVAITDRPSEGLEVARSEPLRDGSSRMSLFRSGSSSRSLDEARPLD